MFIGPRCDWSWLSVGLRTGTVIALTRALACYIAVVETCGTTNEAGIFFQAYGSLRARMSVFIIPHHEYSYPTIAQHKREGGNRSLYHTAGQAAIHSN
jgi:hypothetical protein